MAALVAGKLAWLRAHYEPLVTAKAVEQELAEFESEGMIGTASMLIGLNNWGDTYLPGGPAARRAVAAVAFRYLNPDEGREHDDGIRPGARPGGSYGDPARTVQRGGATGGAGRGRHPEPPPLRPQQLHAALSRRRTRDRRRGRHTDDADTR